MKRYSVCFIGHREIDETEELRNKLCKIIRRLIEIENVDTFLFGSKSRFDSLCLEIVSELKENFSHIKRIYVRSANPYIDDWYEECLHDSYEDTYYPEKINNSGRASYVERNQEMINQSEFCVMYYDESYVPKKRKNSKRDIVAYQPKSGTAVAYNYALKKKKEIINVFC